MNCSLYKDRQIYSMIFNDNLIFFIWQRSLWNLVTSFKTSRRPEHTTYYQLVTANPWDPGPSNSYQWRSPGWCCHCCPASGRWNPRLEWNMPHLKPGRFHRFSNSASIPSVSTEWEPRCTRTKIFWRYLVSGSACCWVSLRCWVCLNLRPVGDLPELWMKGTSFFLRPTQRPFFVSNHIFCWIWQYLYPCHVFFMFFREDFGTEKPCHFEGFLQHQISSSPHWWLSQECCWVSSLSLAPGLCRECCPQVVFQEPKQ